MAPTTRTCTACRLRRGTKRTSVGKRCDSLWSKCVKWGGRPCFNCGATKGITAAHIFGKGAAKNVVRWHRSNGIPLCKGPMTADCHTRFDSYRLDREALILRFLGAERYAQLVMAAQQPWDKDYVAVLNDLKAWAAALEVTS